MQTEQVSRQPDIEESLPLVRSQAWEGCFVGKETTLHQLSPYIGKLKSGMAAELITQLTEPGDTVYDPFAGSGTVALEAWRLGRHVYANDLSPYARLLLHSKLRPPLSEDKALAKIRGYSKTVAKLAEGRDITKTPLFVQGFFHHQTLRETITWAEVLRRNNEWFLLACLLGILHHQRPGFLSFPASHAVPYLRTTKFPESEFPALYEYRPVLERLERKVLRALRRVPNLDLSLTRSIHSVNALQLNVPTPLHAVVTSPPYMRRLSYARDNRLRLWFLGVEDAVELEPKLSPKAEDFLYLMKRCLQKWHRELVPGGYCALVVGDEALPMKLPRLPDAILEVVEKHKIGFNTVEVQADLIPFDRRVRRHASGSKSEVILLLQKDG